MRLELNTSTEKTGSKNDSLETVLTSHLDAKTVVKDSEPPYSPFIALHVGAGCHSQKNIKRLKRLCKGVIRDVLERMSSESEKAEISGDKTKERAHKRLKTEPEREPMTALEAAVEACKQLENSEYTNAGYGSMLSEDGYTECDASIMTTLDCNLNTNACTSLNAKEVIRNGTGASVGCLKTARNPIEVASTMLKDLINVSYTDPIGRVKPIMLVGPGADAYAKRKGCNVVDDPEELISKTSLQTYMKWRRYLSILKTQEQIKAERQETPTNEMKNQVQDTVGVICGDIYGAVVSCASSGGVALKSSGRVGPAALIGSGIYITQKLSRKANDDLEYPEINGKQSSNSTTCAVCTTGTGEDIISCQLASTLANKLIRKEANTDMEYKWIQETIIDAYKDTAQSNPLYFGFLSAHVHDGSVELGMGTTTENMIVGYGVGGKDVTAISLDNPTVGKLIIEGTRVSVKN